MIQRPPRDYRQHLEVETPEHVRLDYEVAGVGSRSLAALADWGILVLLLAAFGLGTSVGIGATPWFAAVMLMVSFATVWGYFTLFEGLRRGQTPGKRWLGIRVIRDTGQPVTLADAATRNLLLPVDLLGLVGLFFIAIHPRARRIGDLVAGTIVVRDQPAEESVAEAPPAAETETLGTPELSDDEFRLLREFAARSAALPADVRARLATSIAGRFAGRFPNRPSDDVRFLERLHGEELGRRRGRFGARGIGGQSVAERLAARKGARWDEFAALAERVDRGGLEALTAAELPDFAGRYREVAADLARARTYRADPRLLVRLERLVAAGHNALYRGERRTWRTLWRGVSRECPAAVVRAWRSVALAASVFLAPALAGYALLRERPGLAPELLPDVILERAEAGAARTALGQGYVEANVGDRPLVASAIITNNLRVAFACFAGGIVLGVGSLVLLAFNGLQIGAVSGHFANAGLLAYLWTFVIGHGVLELFAIWVAGAAGFRLGLALIAPGRLTRRDALVLQGREAILIVGAAAVMLLIAGLVEGFISAGNWPAPARIAVSASSVLFLIVYLGGGAQTTKP